MVGWEREDELPGKLAQKQGALPFAFAFVSSVSGRKRLKTLRAQHPGYP